MNRIRPFFTFHVGILLSIHPIAGMDVIEQKLTAYESLHQVIASSDIVPPQIIRDLFEEARSLDAAIEQLPDVQRTQIIPRAQNIQRQYLATFKHTLKNQVLGSFILDQNRIHKLIASTAVSATWAASLSLVYFSLQVGTGNLERIDQTKIVVAGLEGMVAELVRQGFDQYNARIGNLAASMGKDPLVSLSSAGSAMFIHKKTFLTSPTRTGVLMSGLKTELFVVFNEIIEQSGGIAGILKQVKIPKLLFGTELMSEPQAQLVSHAQPAIHSILGNARIQQALSQILLVTTESMLVGILIYYAGLGFADERSLYATLAGSAFRGIVEGSFSYALNVSGGALPTAMGGLLGRSAEKALLKNAGLEIFSTDLATIVVEKSLHSAFRYAIDESGGLGNFTKAVISKTTRAVNQKWWIPFKGFCLDTCDSVLDRIMGPQ